MPKYIRKNMTEKLWSLIQEKGKTTRKQLHKEGDGE